MGVSFMKKRLLLIFVMIFAVGSISACGKNNKDNDSAKGKDIMVGAKTDSYDSVDKLISSADLVVIGKKTGVENVILNVDNDGDFVNGYTLSNFKVSKIDKDSTGKLTEGSVITVLENEVHDENTGNTYHIAGYTAMNMNDDYVLYLEYNKFSDGQEYYTPLAAVYGISSLGKEYEMIDYGEGVNEEVNALRKKIREKLNIE